MSHSISIMFIDGSWKGSEQEFLELAIERMRENIVQFDSDRLKTQGTSHALQRKRV